MFAKLKALFGGGREAAPFEGVALPGIEYNGYRIRPAPYLASGQYQTAGVIEKDSGEGVKTHRFIRAERHQSKDDAAEFAIAKGRQIIDERGEAIFAERKPAP